MKLVTVSKTGMHMSDPYYVYTLELMSVKDAISLLRLVSTREISESEFNDLQKDGQFGALINMMRHPKSILTAGKLLLSIQSLKDLKNEMLKHNVNDKMSFIKAVLNTDEVFLLDTLMSVPVGLDMGFIEELWSKIPHQTTWVSSMQKLQDLNCVTVTITNDILFYSASCFEERHDGIWDDAVLHTQLIAYYARKCGETYKKIFVDNGNTAYAWFNIFEQNIRHEVYRALQYSCSEEGFAVIQSSDHDLDMDGFNIIEKHKKSDKYIDDLMTLIPTYTDLLRKQERKSEASTIATECGLPIGIKYQHDVGMARCHIVISKNEVERHHNFASLKHALLAACFAACTKHMKTYGESLKIITFSLIKKNVTQTQFKELLLEDIEIAPLARKFDLKDTEEFEFPAESAKTKLNPWEISYLPELHLLYCSLDAAIQAKDKMLEADLLGYCFLHCDGNQESRQQFDSFSNTSP